MKNILVTGGLGYIGSHTVVELINEGYNPIIVDNLNNSYLSVLAGIEEITGRKPIFYQADIMDNDTMYKIFSDYKIDGIIHFAAHKAVGESVQKPLKYYKNNIGGLINLLEVMKTFKVKNIVFSSSCTVYGSPASLPVTEDMPVQKAMSPYGNTKKIAEEILKDDIFFKSIALRYFNPIGAHPSAKIGELPIGTPNNLIPFVTQTAAGIRKELTIFGNDYNTKDGTCIRDYIYIVDLAKAHIKALKHLNIQTKHFDFVNVGTGKGYSVLDVVKSFEKASGKPLNYTIGKKREGDIDAIWADTSLCEVMLNWKAESNLDTMLKTAWEWQIKLGNL